MPRPSERCSGSRTLALQKLTAVETDGPEAGSGEVRHGDVGQELDFGDATRVQRRAEKPVAAHELPKDRLGEGSVTVVAGVQGGDRSAGAVVNRMKPATAPPASGIELDRVESSRVDAIQGSTSLPGGQSRRQPFRRSGNHADGDESVLGRVRNGARGVHDSFRVVVEHVDGPAVV